VASFSYEDNFDEELAEWAQFAEQENTTVLQLRNAMPYAKYLHDRHGYWVFNNVRLKAKAVKHLKRAIEEGPLTKERIVEALKDASDDYIGDLQDFLGGETQPPVVSGGERRPAHPGHWANRTTDLASSYSRLIDKKHRKNYDYDGEQYVDHPRPPETL